MAIRNQNFSELADFCRICEHADARGHTRWQSPETHPSDATNREPSSEASSRGVAQKECTSFGRPNGSGQASRNRTAE